MAEFFNATDLIPRANDSAGTAVSAEPFGLGLEGDFIGFTFNGEHSSHMGITRVSNGNRFNETLLPNFQDRTGSITGRDGMYYFGSQYGQNPIQIQIAYDYLTEYGIRHLRQVFGDKKPHWLIFDEVPYKKFLVKIAQPIQLTYICFMEDNKRIYKGEGQIGFVCYSPFARSVGKTPLDIAKYFNPSATEALPGTGEWLEASGMLENLGTTYDTFKSTEGGGYFTLYNPGDFEADYKLYIPFNEGVINSGTVAYVPDITSPTDYSGQVDFNNIIKQGSDEGVWFNSALELIEGVVTVNGKLQSSGIVYNKHITYGQVFKIPIITIKNGSSNPRLVIIQNEVQSNLGSSDLTYDYLYY